jgi:5-(carboxyamino)imidazole ribonucleotide synthase
MILPGATLGVLGGGQLGQMFVLRARSMGYRTAVLDPDPQSPAGAAADHHICAGYADTAALDELAARCAAVTTEFENIPAAVLAQLAIRTIVHPSAEAVAVAQDRVREKLFFQDCGLATADFAAVASVDQLSEAARRVGAPAILKTNRLGYDGKGQVVLDDMAGLPAAFASLGGVPCILEARLHLEREISVVVARSADGMLAAFPPAENVHRHGILHTSTVPAEVTALVAREAVRAAEKIASALAYVGVLGVEFFVANGGKLFVNEMAPRPHNSGHWTQDGCSVDQFEQQVRALAGLPLGTPVVLAPTCMVNLLGDLWAHGEPQWHRALGLPGVRLHLYGKAEPRPGRKMGHLNVTASSAAGALAMATAAAAAAMGEGSPAVP